MVVGLTYPPGQADKDLLIVKLAHNGSKSWMKLIGGVGTDYGLKVKRIDSGGYIVCGKTSSGLSGLHNALLMRIS